MRTTEQQDSYINKALSGEIDNCDSLINILPVLICELTADGRILYVNKTFENVTGFGIQELSNKNFEEVFHYSLIDHLEEKDRSFPAKIETKDKSPKTISWNFVELNKNGKEKTFLYSGMEVTEKKEKEEELLFSEKRFREFSDAALEGIITLYNDKVVDANRRFLEITGFKIEELKDMDSAKRLFSSNSWNNIVETRKEESEPFEGELIDSDNKIHNVLMNIGRLSQDGFVLDIITLQDITNHKIIEEKLRRERSILDNVRENSPIGIIFYDRDGNIIQSNGYIERKLGASKQELVGKKYNAPIVKYYKLDGSEIPEDDQVFVTVKKTGGRIFEREQILELERRGRIIISVNAAPIYDSKGLFEGVVEILSDITYKYNAEKELRQERNLLNRIMETSPIGIVLLEPDGKFSFANRNGEEIFKLSRREMGELIFNNPEFRIYDCQGEKVPSGAATFVRTMENGEQMADNCLMFKWNSGEIKYFSVNTAPLFDENEKIENVIVIFQDITDRKLNDIDLERLNKELEQRAEQLMESNQILENFAAIASHDLRAPLTIIRGYSIFLKKQYGDKFGDKANDYIDYIAEETERMQTLINGLLKISQVNAEGKPFKEFDTHNVLRRVLSNLKDMIEENQAKIHHEELPRIHGDEVQISQVFQNLLTNAIKFRKEDTPPDIYINVEEKKDEYVFSFRDNGIGIEKKDEESIFDVFKRLRDAEKEGVGLGLAITRKIIIRHGGKIWVESEPGKGSTFYFTIPREKSLS
jgi:PAS domain S-box-containing protein